MSIPESTSKELGLEENTKIVAKKGEDGLSHPVETTRDFGALQCAVKARSFEEILGQTPFMLEELRKSIGEDPIELTFTMLIQRR